MSSQLEKEILEGLVENINIDLPDPSDAPPSDDSVISLRSMNKAKYQSNKSLLRQKYHYEKWTGKRKENGALKLNKLKPVHLRMISAFINGMKLCEIAEQFNVAAITVCRVIADPLARGYIGEFEESFKNEFKAMFPLVAEAIRGGLDSGNQEVRLKAVDRFVKVNSMLGGPDNGDALESKMEARTQARHKFVAMVKSALSEGADVIIEAEEVIETHETVETRKVSVE